METHRKPRQPLPTIKLDKRAIDGARGKPQTYRVEGVAGFMLIVRERSMSYVVQRDVQRKAVRVTLGNADYRDGGLTPEGARRKALRTLSLMEEGVNPNEVAKAARKEKERTTTLQEALDLYIASKKDLAERTVEGLRWTFDKYLEDWLGLSLEEVAADRKAIRKRHEKITRKHGPYAANGTMRALRAVYNRARREDPTLPENPVVNVDWNKEKPRVATLEPEQLRAWHKAVQTLSPIRRDYYLFLLFTGLRRTSAAEVRWEHVDWEAETVFIPKPKGGEDRAFKLPLSDFLMTLLKRRQEENTSIFPGSPWVFPTQDRKGRIRPLSEPKEYVELKEEAPATYRNGKPKLDRRGRPIMAIRVVRDEQGRAKKIRRPGMELGYPHALRHSYADYALAAGVGLTDIKFLMNHRNRDITESYMKGLMVALKPLQQKITDYILNTLEPRDTKGNVRKLVTAG